jgi:hypothetical protein
MAVKAERSVEPPALLPYAPERGMDRTNRSASGCPGGLSSGYLGTVRTGDVVGEAGATGT